MTDSQDRRATGDRETAAGGTARSFVEMVERARTLVERNRRLSLRALRLEFALSDIEFDALVEELVEVQQVVALNGRVLDWRDAAAPRSPDNAAAALAARTAQPLPPASPTATVPPASTPASADPVAAAAIGERRQLTVMFSDLVGSTALARSLDGEDLRDLLSAFHRLAATVVSRFDGHVAEYLGDGLLVYFGFPRAREDDPERAVRAGLAIVSALDDLNLELAQQGKPTLAVRVGIHTGPVVVSAVGQGPGADLRAIGETLNVAARMQGEAEPHSVVISPATLRLVQSLFQTRDLGSRVIKGLGEMHVHEVLNVTAVPGALDLDPTQSTALIGRDREVGLLYDRWEQVKEGDGKAVLISGEAGLGKSRLVRALRERMAREPHLWLECACVRDRHASAYYPLINLIERGVGCVPHDPPDVRLHKLETTLARSGLALAESVPLLASVLSLPIPASYPPLHYAPEIRQRKTLAAMCEWLFVVAGQQPVLLLVEDLQWCDPSTLEFLTLVLEQTPTAPILTVLSFRPEFQPPWPARSHMLHLEACRLTLRQAEALITGMPCDPPLSAEMIERIVARGDGVPLFLEELTKMVSESGCAHAADHSPQAYAASIPDTLNDLLMARLDRLGQGKQVAQLGAVLGRRFPHDLLRAVARTSDAELAAAMNGLLLAELLYTRGMPPTTTYSFKHALVQDTAYQSLLRSERRRIHAETAQALEQQFPDRAASEPEVVARHYDEAGLVSEAVIHYQRAASRARRRFANQDAIDYLRRALHILGTQPPSPLRDQSELSLQLALGTPLYLTHGWANADYGQSLERARALATALGDDAALFGVSMGLYFHHQFAGDLTQAENCARQALALTAPTAGVVDTLVALSGLSQTLYLQGHFDPALEHIEKLIEIYYAQTPVPAPTAIVLPAAKTRAAARAATASSHLDLPSAGGAASALRGVRALCYWALGYPDQALALCDAALASARQHDSPFNLASACIYSGWMHQKRRERASALRAAQEAYELCGQYGFSLLSWATVLRGCVMVEPGVTTRAAGARVIAQMQDSIAGLLATGTRGWVPHCYSVLAELCVNLGRDDDALRAVDQGLACAQQTGQRYEDSELLRLRGAALLHATPTLPAAAEQSFQAALAAAVQEQAKALELRAATALAKLWLAQGKGDAAHQLLAPVHAWFSEGTATADWRDGAALLETLRQSAPAA